ncbi:Serine/threonine-protein kinase tel1 [Trichoderma cornu-damae]|uniref:Serine/threonine-protein kinase Tel1 n=1 Tax=Trichoderma cornu-damae TaxID=654480 RepID=A0A9P8TUA0_9HYPO|nr:Serine/threonine-protein kinase tel1 [Trichoderma cornu-damae]
MHLKDLINLLNPRNTLTNLSDLGDKSYHEIFEAIFSFVLHQKPVYYDGSKSQPTLNSAASRLSKCAAAVRMATIRGASKIGRKTLLAVMDHITQVLPGPDDDFVWPLLQDYVKALAEIMSRQANVELLARKKAEPWQVCVDFFLDVALNVLSNESNIVSLPHVTRNSPALATSSSRAMPISNPSPQAPRHNGPGEGGPLKDALEGLYHLVSAANAPILQRMPDITDLALRVLNVKHPSLGSMQTLCFSIINTVFQAIEADSLDDAISLAKNVSPHMGYWWRAERVSQDELITALRNEISRGIFLMHLHLEYLAINLWDVGVRNELESLVESLWQEYSKRSEAFRLQLTDLTFTPSASRGHAMQLGLFGLHPHNIQGESHWAIVQNLAFLEAMLLRPKKDAADQEVDNRGQLRKKRRINQDPNPIKVRLKSKDIGVVRTALQLVPFMLVTNTLSHSEINELLIDLAGLAGDKNGLTASWALIACSSCALWSKECRLQQGIWTQIWHSAARSISVPRTSRAACLSLHSIIETDILPYHNISDDINNIITTADINGPGILCDTSLALMSHLYHIRNSRLPNASQNTSSHIIRWVFLRWNPSELAYASFQSAHVRPIDLVNLLHLCYGAQPLSSNGQDIVSGGLLGETWISQREIGDFNEYLLLLGHETADVISNECCYSSAKETPPLAADATSFFALKKLVLELLYPKLEELKELCVSWTKRASDGGTQISFHRFQSLMSACITGTLLMSSLSDLNPAQSSSMEALLLELAEEGVSAALSSIEPTTFINLTLKALRPCMPEISTEKLSQLCGQNPGVLSLLSKISEIIEQRQPSRHSENHTDLMDIDDFDSYSSQVASASSAYSVPRQNVQLCLNPQAFYIDTRLRLTLLRLIHQDRSQLGLLPDPYVYDLLARSNEELLSCQRLLIEIVRSDLIVKGEAALAIIERLGKIVGNPEYQSCEVAQTTCIEVIDGLSSIWLQDSQDLAGMVGDLYDHFIKVCFPSNILSPRTQMSLARLLFNLLRTSPGYGTSLRLDSCRTSLFLILKKGPMKAKCFIAERVADIFELYILMLHDEVFLDILDSLPADADNNAGIAFRLLALSKIACRWPTLLRRCTYHIFETPGKISQSVNYAKRSLADISVVLNLKSPTELFRLFSHQLLYTWLEVNTVESIPFSIFGFSTLGDLLKSAQAEAIGLTVMRGQETASAEIARLVGISETQLIQQNFATALSYGLLYAATFESQQNIKGEDRIRKKLGSKPFVESIYIHFIDIVALFFDLIDQEDPIEKLLLKQTHLKYAGENLEAIKAIAHSPAILPPNQQPMFRAKHVLNELVRLCQGTEYQFHNLWTPAVVVTIARKLFNTVHPALGPLHACSVIRKVRILVCLAGPVALESYCLEMLLSSIRSFIVDSECADDALGISQYLLSGGGTYLTQVPSFLAGYSLSALASLRVFLESSQSSTTQESQFKATMSKAQKFYEWFSQYLVYYISPRFESQSQNDLFKSITLSAAHIRSSGNAEKNTSESKLLLDILNDEMAESQLLNESSRQLTLGLLCGDFTIPAHVRNDVVESDRHAVSHASAVWKSCGAQNLSEHYLAWAGRVVGRSFLASGSIPEDIPRESQLGQYERIAPGPHGSEMGLLHLLQDLTMNPNSVTAGLAEAALRAAISQAIVEDDAPLITAGQRSLSESLFTASQWGSYRTPPSEAALAGLPDDKQFSWTEDITSQGWLPRLSAFLAQGVSSSILLSVLSPVLLRVKGFAEKAFPFVVHLVLYFQLEQQQAVKRSLSSAMKQWLGSTGHTAKENIKLLINTVLYLRTQEYPKESSIADRLHWLDIDYAIATSSATRCGMHKTALLFAEIAASETARASRRSSAAKEADMNETLLAIFENIDDPDAYYGVSEDASLSNVLSRLEYEQAGTKNLAFRGAQYDSHIRLRQNASESDAHALVKALGTLGFAGLSHSLMQTQQNLGSTPSSIESTFHTARRLEIWNLPVPTTSDHYAVVAYKAYQTMHQATSLSEIRTSIYDGFARTMKNLVANSSNATAIRSRLGALAALSELDEILNISDVAELEGLMGQFQERSQWMKSGIYDDVSQILSCRGTTMSMFSQHASLLGNATLSVADIRQMEIKSMLLASGLYRYHQATQESLNISTALSDLIKPCEDLGVHVDAAVKIEVANSLWDHGEMSSSIKMLQGIDDVAALRKQAIPVSRSDLLSKIGHRMSVARLEKPRDIQKKYLEPALKELKGGVEAKEAGLVFHQFAVFCDEQLQDPDSLEDLTRLQNLKKGKSEEVEELKSLISSTRDSQLRAKYSHVLSKEMQWLDLDEQELRRVEMTRSEFVRLSLENYLLSLASSDEHNNDALRFTALWLERSDDDTTNKAVLRHLSKVPTAKFAGLMSQLTSRLQDQNSTFQALLSDLVCSICVDHPYHGMYHIWSGTKARVQQKDEVAALRVKANDKIAQKLANTEAVADVWVSIEKTSKYYHGLALERDPSKYKSGAKIALKDSAAAKNLMNYLAKYRIPPPTMHIEVNANKDYSRVPMISRLEPAMTIASGVSAPKIITAIGTDGVKYKQLVKGGQDDLRQDAIMEQVFAAVSSLLKLHRATRQRNLGIRTYKVLPLTASSGLIEFVRDTIPLHEFLMPAHERYHPRDLKGAQCRKEIFNVQNKTVEQRISTYRKVTERFQPVMRYFFMEYFVDPDEWFVRRLAYTRSTAAISMLGHVLGLGDRHGHNILLDTKTGEAVHIDLGIAFETGRILPVPELVPFRLTRDIVDGMGITKTEGVFRRCCEVTLDALREEQYSIMTILDVLRYDPLYSWSVSPVRLAKLQKARQNDDGAIDDADQADVDTKKGKKPSSHLNEPSEGDRALEVVRKKLSKTLSVTATVNDLINQATDERNLAVLYSGWAAYA